jgi:hypothetical protein
MNRKILAFILSLSLTDICLAGAFFNKSGNDYIDTGFVWSGLWTTGLTISLWFRTDVGDTYTSEHEMVSDYTSAGGPADIQFALLSNVVYSYVRDQSNHAMESMGSTPINDNRWHHEAMVVTGTTLNLYVDGKLDATSTNNSYTGNLEKNNVNIGSNSNGTAFFTGTLDDIRMYKVGLSLNQILSLASSRSRLSISDNYVAYYPLDEGTDGIVIINMSHIFDRSQVHSFDTAIVHGNTTFLWKDSNWISYP